MTDFDFSSCEQEPIHLVGSIQRGGYLIGVDAETRVVRFGSGNLFRLLGRPVAALCGQPLESVFDRPSAAALGAAIANESFGYANLMTLSALDYEGHLVPIVAVINPANGAFLIEFATPLATEERLAGLETIRAADTPKALLQACCDLVFEVSRYDRVMAYVFDADYNGEVVAESRRSDVASYLRHHFPAHDIPRQARELYLKNTVRVIDNVAADPELLEGPDSRFRVDLTHSVYRTVSPVHIEYLRNMGVAASMSLSLIADGRLYGLIAAHAIVRRGVGLRVRAHFAELIGVVNRRLQAFLDREHAELAERFDQARSALFGPAASIVALRHVFHCDRIVRARDGRIETDGETPAAEAWVRQLLAEIPPAELSFTDRHANGQWPGIAHIPLADGGRLLLLRTEWSQTIHWGGNPYDPNTLPFKGGRVEPRKSFATYEQIISGRSSPWTAEQRAFAARLMNGDV